MNTSFNFPVNASGQPAQITRLQRVLATTLADWRAPLATIPAIDDDETPRARRRCSLLSRTPRPATARFPL